MDNIDDMVYGHKQAKKMIQVLLNRSQNRYYRTCVLGETNVPETLKCLIFGPSGTGKTHLIQSYQKLYKFPLICLDATQLMPTGNSDGTNIRQLKKKIKYFCEKEAEKPGYFSPEGVLNQLVIYVDEFDKLGNSFESTGNWNQQVQSNFLTIVDNKEEFAGISWIFTGAFSKLFENRVKSNSIGFFQEPKQEKADEITDRQLIQAGIIPEMLGRISLIVQLDTFTKENYTEILTTRIMPKYKLDICHEKIDEIVTKAMESGQGIRSMTRQIEMLAIDAEFEAHPTVEMARGKSL